MAKNEKRRDKSRQEKIFAGRTGMSFADFQKILETGNDTAPNRFGMSPQDFRNVILKSKSAYFPENLAENDVWTGKHYSYFSNRECEYFPCHPGADPDNFNCLFCYCPLYMLGGECGGNYIYLDNGYKDCTNCLYPHNVENYDAITARYADILARMAENDDR